MRQKQLLRCALFASASLLVTACSGGGGSSSTPTPAPLAGPPPPPMPADPVTAVPFSEESISKGLMHGFGYSNDVDVMVRQFAGGAAAGDVDGDGDIDVFVVRGNLGPNLLYINRGAAGFTENAAAANLAYTGGGLTNNRQSGPVFGDLDGDRDLDLFVGGLQGDPSQIFLNDGTGVFTDATAGTGLEFMTSIHTVSAALGDYDLDGDLDLAMAHWGTPRNSITPGETETLWRNDSDANGLRFIPVSLGAGIADGLALDLDGALGPDHDYTFAPSFADVTGDGYPDLLSVSDFRGSRIFENNQDGTFTDITNTAVISDRNGMGSAVGDIDNDGDLDWFVSAIEGNKLYENLGDGSFGPAPGSTDIELGGWGWGSCFADFNGDGTLDIYQTNGWDIGADPADSPYVNDTTRLWMADTAGQFEDRAADSGVDDIEQGRGIVCDDFDNDGDVDVMQLTTDTQHAIRLWTNQLSGAGYLAVELKGLAPNTAAIGAQISITVDGARQFRMVGINSNFTSHNSTRQIFGLSDATRVQGVNVTWPDGQESLLSDIAINQTLVISHPQNP